MTGDNIPNISDAVAVFQNFFAMPPGWFPGLFGFTSGVASAPSTIPRVAGSFTEPTTASRSARQDDLASTTRLSRSETESGVSDQSDDDLSVLDQVLSDPVGDLLIV